LEWRIGISILPSMYGIRLSREGHGLRGSVTSDDQGYFPSCLLRNPRSVKRFFASMIRYPIETSGTAFRLGVFSRHFIGSCLVGILIKNITGYHTGKLWDPGCGSATVLILLQMLLSSCYGREALIRSTTVALWQTSGYVDNMKSSLVTNTMRLKLRENF